MASDDLPSRAKKIVYRLDPIPFFTVIYNLSSSDDSARSDAEKIYEVLRREYPIALCTKLFKLFESPQATIWPNLSIMFRNKLKENLLHSLENQKDLNVFYNLRATASDLVEDILPQNQWPELNLFISFSLSSASSRAHFVVFSLFVELAPKIGEILSVHEDEVHNACVKDMTSESEDLTVRVAAVRASVSLILYLTTESNWEKFEQLSVHLANTLSKAINKKLDLARKVLDCMIVLAEEKTGILRNHIDFLVGSMITIAKQEGLQDETRNLAIEFVLTVAEDRKEGCGMIEKLYNDLNSLLGILMEMLMSVEDDKSWYDAGSDNLNAVASSEFFHGKQSFRRLALALGGNAIFRNYREMLSEFLVDKDWRKRHAAVTALGSIIEGCSKVSDEHLGNLIEIVMSFFQDSHPRVCWAAINAAGQFCKDLDPQLQNQLQQHLVPALTVAMDDSKNPRVQAQAVSAMQLFSCNCTPDILKPHLKGIVSKLLYFLQKGKRMLKEGALTTLASIASLMKDDFEQYYDTVMPYLILMLLSETEKHNGMLVAKSVDCITMVGLAVGKEKFSGDAQQVVEVLISLQESQLETDDPLRRHLLQAWGRLCKCLGQDFLPYMSVAMPQLLDSARLNIYLSDHNGTVQSDDGSMEEQTSTSGRFWIKPWVLEEKVLACNMLCCCAAELKGGLHLWIYEVAETLVPLLKFKFDGEVRSAAVTAMPLLLRSTISALEERLHLPGFNESPIKELSCRIIPALVESLNKKHKTEIRGKILDSLTECIQGKLMLLGYSALTPFNTKKKATCIS